MLTILFFNCKVCHLGEQFQKPLKNHSLVVDFQLYFCSLSFCIFFKRDKVLMPQLWFSMASVLLCFNMREGTEDAFPVASWRQTHGKYISLFLQINVGFWTDRFHILDKYILQFRQICLRI